MTRKALISWETAIPLILALVVMLLLLFGVLSGKVGDILAS